ncbi:hypothetical protein JCM21714_787 [Gracilibacillus boraciitolerans JCM 21714]|uniref:Zinc-ribbon domain-containing protein n=1 Tax=Gracilibacillus boraciitolerans JCM 21714 TaxID=1298598 RepID=W4VG88_9BACI|nr:zinc ribbon domain-containing protein [Gracilibacillus boraciitolerans]GAE91828.1 hypothetical protein JCM21714_787 [Gracilibacillus boraciitolerans JCM 21714]
MSFCPNCGGQVQESETFCVYCGKRLPADLNERTVPKKPTTKWWLLPTLSLVIASIIIISIPIFTNYQSNQAKSLYQDAKDMALIGDYSQAHHILQQAIDYKKQFPAAIEVISFLNIATNVESDLQNVEKLNKQKKFEKAFDIIQQAERDIQNYNGDLVDQLIINILATKNQTILEQSSYKFNNDPTVEDLKNLFWEMEEISDEKAIVLKEQIQEKLIAMTYQKATTLLDDLQFSRAMRVIDDTLYVIENSEQLESLKATVNKEKTAFETVQEQRIEQALSVFEKEQEVNESNAIEQIDIKLTEDKDKWVINGTLKSVATVPIHSILVSYSISDKHDQIVLENEIYVYPETLYPDEFGNFEFTHFDIPADHVGLTAKIEEITWYLE